MKKPIHELSWEIMTSAGMGFKNRLSSHGFSLHIFKGNYRELRESIASLENVEDDWECMTKERARERKQAHQELNRMLHNFLAASMTLIEHTRNMMKEYYEETPIKSAYQEKIKAEFSDDQLCRFIQDLRNYMLHRGLPHSLVTISWSRTDLPEFIGKVRLNVEKIKDWSNWTPASRLFMKKQKDLITIESIVKPYGEKVSAFYEWLYLALDGFHADDLEELRLLQEEYNARTKK